LHSYFWRCRQHQSWFDANMKRTALGLQAKVFCSCS
jgi:hypothetical protein